MALKGQARREDVARTTRDEHDQNQRDQGAPRLSRLLLLFDLWWQEVDPRLAAEDQPGVFGAHALLPSASPRATVIPPRPAVASFSATRVILTPPKPSSVETGTRVISPNAVSKPGSFEPPPVSRMRPMASC